MNNNRCGAVYLWLLALITVAASVWIMATFTKDAPRLYSPATSPEAAYASIELKQDGYAIAPMVRAGDFLSILNWALENGKLTPPDNGEQITLNGKPLFYGDTLSKQFVYCRPWEYALGGFELRIGSDLWDHVALPPMLIELRPEHLPEDHTFAYISENGDALLSHITRLGAMAYCNWMSEMQGYTPTYDLDKQQRLADRPTGYFFPTADDWDNFSVEDWNRLHAFNVHKRGQVVWPGVTPAEKDADTHMAQLIALPPLSADDDSTTAVERLAGERRFVDIGDGTLMAFVWIPPGAFIMGSPRTEIEGREDETQRQVTLESGFWLGKFEVTQEQWEAVMGDNPSVLKGPQHPVTGVSWDNIQDFLKKLNSSDREAFRLPTEAEWEYACRAGSDTAYCFGDDPLKLDAYGWSMRNRQGMIQPVGRKRPNAWGLHDMHGNVAEWCQDWYGKYTDGPVVDPTGPDSGTQRVARGGSWNAKSPDCRAAARQGIQPAQRDHQLGFRLAALDKHLDELIRAAEEEAAKRAEEDSAKRAEEEARSAGEALTVALDDKTKMELVWIPAGTFLVGSSESESGREKDEGQHEVTLTRGFWMGRYELTQAQWEAVMNDNPSAFKGRDLPVENVSWNDAQKFCEKLNEQGHGVYRMPTEAEWEYACRAGSTTAYSFGDSSSQLSNYAWHEGNSQRKTHPVGKKRSNAWGLYDMPGNVWEWCHDWYGDYPSGAMTDPSGPNFGSFRTLRGGSWSNNPSHCRSACRRNAAPDARYYSYGFRVVRTP